MSIKNVNLFQTNDIYCKNMRLDFSSINSKIGELAQFALKKRTVTFQEDQFINASDNLEFLIMEKENQVKHYEFINLQEKEKVLRTLSQLAHKIDQIKKGVILNPGTDSEDISLVLDSFFYSILNKISFVILPLSMTIYCIFQINKKTEDSYL
jgi:hypothetical protein